jgi:hypothetical protein
MNPETTYLENLESIERIAAFVARRGHLNADETGEFVQIVRVKLFEDDYAIIRKFEGRSLVFHVSHDRDPAPVPPVARGDVGQVAPSAEARRPATRRSPPSA